MKIPNQGVGPDQSQPVNFRRWLEKGTEMYMWKIAELKNQLIRNDLTDAEAFKYLMANSILLTAATIQYGVSNQYDMMNGFVGLFATIIGTWIAYKLNGGYDGKQFVHRYLAICWVAFIRFFVLIILPLIVAKLVLEALYLGGVPEGTTLADVVFVSAMETIFIAVLARHIKQVAGAANNANGGADNG